MVMATARCCMHIMALSSLLGHCASLPLPFAMDAATSLDLSEENRTREAPDVLFGGLTIPSHHMDRQSFPQSMPSKTEHGREAFPLAWDSRTNPAFKACFASLAEVGDQGNCGSSWAIVASQSYHDVLCLTAIAQGGGEVRGVTASQNATHQLSAMDVLTCAPASAAAFGCGGAVLTAGFEYFLQGGVCSSGCKAYPWSGKKGPGHDEKATPSCNDVCDKSPGGGEGRHARYRAEREGTKLGEYATLGWDGEVSADPQDVKREIMKRGSVATELAVYPSFLSYRSGIYSPSGDPLTGSAVRLVGWGTAPPGTCWWEDKDGVRHDSSRAPGGSCDFWTAVATVGSSFGEEGAFRIVSGQALVASAVVFAEPG